MCLECFDTGIRLLPKYTVYTTYEYHAVIRFSASSLYMLNVEEKTNKQ